MPRDNNINYFLVVLDKVSSFALGFSHNTGIGITATSAGDNEVLHLLIFYNGPGALKSFFIYSIFSGKRALRVYLNLDGGCTMDSANISERSCPYRG